MERTDSSYHNKVFQVKNEPTITNLKIIKRKDLAGQHIKGIRFWRETVGLTDTDIWRALNEALLVSTTPPVLTKEDTRMKPFVPFRGYKRLM